MPSPPPGRVPGATSSSPTSSDSRNSRASPIHSRACRRRSRFRPAGKFESWSKANASRTKRPCGCRRTSPAGSRTSSNIRARSRSQSSGRPGPLSSPGNLQQQRVSDVGERALIERIRSRVPPAPPALVVGIGDDAAVAAPDRGSLQVLTTDALVEGVHFDRRFSSAADIGYKALAVNASDVASMGGSPRFALLSLMLPESLLLLDLDGLLDGLLQMAAECGVALAGGNITRSPGPLVVDVTAIGSVKPRKILTRGGGRPGDALYVTGHVGAAAAGLDWLRSATLRGETPADAMPPGGVAPGWVERPADAGMAECVAR